MIEELAEDVYLHEWDWKASPDWSKINSLINNNLGRIIHFYEVETKSDENAVVISFNININQPMAEVLYKKHNK